MDIKINVLDVDRGYEVGMDQYKNVYSRPEKTTAWEILHEYRRIPKTRKSSHKDMKIIGEYGLFKFAADNTGKYWKKYLNYDWKEFIYEDLPKYGLTCTIMGCLTQDYWTRESKNSTVIKRHCEIPLRGEKRMKEDPNFWKMITPDRIIKRRKQVTKGLE